MNRQSASRSQQHEQTHDAHEGTDPKIINDMQTDREGMNVRIEGEGGRPVRRVPNQMKRDGISNSDVVNLWEKLGTEHVLSVQHQTNGSSTGG